VAVAVGVRCRAGVNEKKPSKIGDSVVLICSSACASRRLVSTGVYVLLKPAIDLCDWQVCSGIHG